MSLLIDSRVGSGELAPLFKMLGVPTEVTELQYGDFAFLGLGEGGVPVPVGIERKTLQDFVNSTMTGRFAGHQLPGLLDPTTGYQDVWLVVEGLWRASQSGVLEVPKGKGSWAPLQYGTKIFMYKELESLLLTLEIRGGCRVRVTSGKMQTCHFLASLYRWWTSKELEGHKSHLRFRSVEADTALLTPPSLTRLMAKELPGVGWKKSGGVANHFGSVYSMVQADPKEWEQVEGIGKTMAFRIWKALRGM